MRQQGLDAAVIARPPNQPSSRGAKPRAEAAAWAERRNAVQVGVDWQFTTDDARTKLKRLYPKMEVK